MCELFGFSGKTVLDTAPWLRTLVSHSTEHPHGWGIASFYADAVNLEKEPRCAWVSDYLRGRLEYPVEARAMIAHIRQATRGSMDYPNCHPFVRQDITRRTWTLAHNGTIFESDLLDSYRSVQLGGTDSERILCHIVERSNALASGSGRELSREERFRMMDSIIGEISCPNKLNLLVYDGQLLYVHTNMAHTLYRKTVAAGTLFATVPLDENGWEPVPMMQLLAYENGTQVFSGTRYSWQYLANTQSEDNSGWIGL